MPRGSAGVPLGNANDPPCPDRHFTQPTRGTMAQMADLATAVDDLALPSSCDKGVVSLAPEGLCSFASVLF